MPTLDITKSYQDGIDLTEAQLDDAFESLETFMNTTKLDSDNMQAGGIQGASLAAGSVTETKIGSAAVTTNKIADGNVTGAKLHSNVADGSTLEVSASALQIKALGVTAAKLAADAVETAKIKDGAVTQAKRVALGQQISESCALAGGFASGSPGAISNLSVSLTTTGRPVMVQLVADGSANYSRFYVEGSGVAYIYRDSTLIAETLLTSSSMSIPPSSFGVLDAPGAGTYTYTVKGLTLGGTAAVYYAKLLAYEL